MSDDDDRVVAEYRPGTSWADVALGALAMAALVAVYAIHRGVIRPW